MRSNLVFYDRRGKGKDCVETSGTLRIEDGKPKSAVGGDSFVPGFISVIIPCFNEAKVLQQTLQNLVGWRRRLGFEIIVSDDASSDHTMDIAKQGADQLVINPGVARGPAAARNRGAAKARGEFLVFIDADILIQDPPFFFGSVRRFFSRQCAMAATAACMVYPWEATWADNIFHRLYNHYLRALNALGIAIASGWCQIVRSRHFHLIGGYDPAFITGQDVDLFIRLRQYGKTRLLPDVVIYESPRRYRRIGLAKLVWKWFLNGLSVYLLRRPFLNRYPPVR
jgi:glycosyltransferase involved in cell wall biosynthesis